MVLDDRILSPQIEAGVPGTGYAHCLWVEDGNLEEVAGCQLLMPGLVPSLLHFVGFIEVHP